MDPTELATELELVAAERAELGDHARADPLWEAAQHLHDLAAEEAAATVPLLTLPFAYEITAD